MQPAALPSCCASIFAPDPRGPFGLPGRSGYPYLPAFSSPPPALSFPLRSYLANAEARGHYSGASGLERATKA